MTKTAAAKLAAWMWKNHEGIAMGRTTWADIPLDFINAIITETPNPQNPENSPVMFIVILFAMGGASDGAGIVPGPRAQVRIDPEQTMSAAIELQDMATLERRRRENLIVIRNGMPTLFDMTVALNKPNGYKFEVNWEVQKLPNN